MKRKSSPAITLALVGAIPLILTGCDEPQKAPEVATVTNSKTFANMQACVDDKVPTDICQNALIQAMQEHKKVAPTFSSQTDCEDVFMKDSCVETSGAQWMPKLAGFQITESHEVPVEVAREKQREEQQATQTASGQNGVINTGGGAAAGGTTIINNTSGGASHSGVGDFMLGYALGNLSNASAPRYYAQPVYVERTSRGDYRTSTLKQRIDEGQKFEKSTQSRSGWDYSQKPMSDSLANRAATTRIAPQPPQSTASKLWGAAPSSSSSYKPSNSGSSWGSSGSSYSSSSYGSSYKSTSSSSGSSWGSSWGSSSKSSASSSRSGFGSVASARGGWSSGG